MRTDKEGNDDSVDFLLFQVDSEDRIRELWEADPDMYDIVCSIINKRLKDLGLTKSYFIDSIVEIFNDTGKSKNIFNNLIVNLAKWQSVVLDMYILGHIFTFYSENVIIYTGGFNSDTIRIVLSALHFDEIESHKWDKDYIIINEITF
jgi:hypothetical protein